MDEFSPVEGLSYFCEKCWGAGYGTGSHYQRLVGFSKSGAQMKAGMLRLMTEPCSFSGI